jgi:3-hydroxyacyl-CoA dehydrogenase
MATSPIRTVGVVGTGVIGSSRTLLFLAKGLSVIVTDPAPGAHEKLAGWLKQGWPTMEKIGLGEGASLATTGSWRISMIILGTLV